MMPFLHTKFLTYTEANVIQFSNTVAVKRLPTTARLDVTATDVTMWTNEVDPVGFSQVSCYNAYLFENTGTYHLISVDNTFNIYSDLYKESINSNAYKMATPVSSDQTVIGDTGNNPLFPNTTPLYYSKYSMPDGYGPPFMLDYMTGALTDVAALLKQFINEWTVMFQVLKQYGHPFPVTIEVVDRLRTGSNEYTHYKFTHPFKLGVNDGIDAAITKVDRLLHGINSDPTIILDISTYARQQWLPLKI
jgi:hypothetical protein